MKIEQLRRNRQKTSTIGRNCLITVGRDHGLDATLNEMDLNCSPRNGNYVFTLAKTPRTSANIYLNQGGPGGAFVGWQFL